MSLSPATIVHQGNVAGGVIPDISSALGYKEHIGSACINPNGYTAGSYFVGADDGYFYCVTANIAAGDTITIGTNCVQTDVAAEISRISSDLTKLTSGIIVESKTVPITTSGSASYATGRVDITKSGYIPIAVSWIPTNTVLIISATLTTNLTSASYTAQMRNDGAISGKSFVLNITYIPDITAP